MDELEALRLVYLEACELIAEYDQSGNVDRANIEALRCLLYRVAIRREKQSA